MIAWNDKDFLKSFPDLLDMATAVTFQAESNFSKNPCPYQIEQINSKKSPFSDAGDPSFSPYDNLKQNFLDTLFGDENKISRQEWIDGVKDNNELNYLFYPDKIRLRLDYEI